MLASGNRFSRPLTQGDALDIWALSAIGATYFPGEPATAFAGQGYRFINGFVAIGDLPCRRAFRATMIGRPVAPQTDWPVETLRLPAVGTRIDFTGFWHRPTHLQRWARTEIVADGSAAPRVKLTTCGGLRLWVNGREIFRFEPYIRNTPSTTEFVLPLEAGANDILVLAEDMAERDTTWFFELTLVDALDARLVLPFAADPALVADVAMLARSARPEHGLFVGQPLAVAFDHGPSRDVTMRARVLSVHHDHTTRLDTTVTLAAGQARAKLAPPGTVADGLFALALDFQIGSARVERRIEAAFLASVTPPPAAPEIAGRKLEAARWLAANGQPRMGRIVAMMASDTIDVPALRHILETTLRLIEERHDCSDFEMVPLLWVWRQWRDRLPADLVPRIRDAILGYRYWVDEPGNDVMWFWSENHVLCFHVSQYLAGQLFPDEIFTCSGRTGAEQMALGRTRLGLWFDAIEEEGLAEWNSAAYYPVDFIGLIGLDQGAEPELKRRARRLMDRIFAMVALHVTAGVPGGSQGRAYTKELLAGPLTELASVARIAFGSGWLNEGVAAAGLFAASDYAPSPHVLALAALGAGRTLEARYTQGVDHAGKLVVYRGEHMQMSTVVEHQTGRPGHQQHVVDVLLSGHPLARVFVNHPGEEDPSGSARPSFWAGNGILPRVAQHLDVALLVFDTGDARVGWTHAYLGEGLDEVRHEAGWTVVRSGNGFAALYAANGLTLQTGGQTAGHEIRSPGRVNGWVVAVGQGDGDDFRAFVARLATSRVSFDAQKRLLALAARDRPALVLRWEEGLMIDGKAANFSHLVAEPVITWRSEAAGDVRPIFGGMPT